MRQTMRVRGSTRYGTISIAVAAVIASSVATLAQVTLQRAIDPTQRQVVLVHQEASDCSGSDVPNVDSPLVGGMVTATRLFDGNTSVSVAMTMKPNTTYRF